MSRLSVVIPVYNERATVRPLLERVLAVPLPLERELVVVDDGSTDGTRELLQAFAAERPESGVRLFLQDRNRGKGAAVRRGFAEATGDFVVIQDADLEYDPRDFPKLLEPLLDGRADVVFGSRFLGGPHRVLMYWHYVGNKLLTTMTNALYNVNLSDMETCYKAFTRDALRAVGSRLTSDRFGIEPELAAEVCRRHLRIYEVPISYSGRTYAEGKKITWRDGLVALGVLLCCRFRSRR